MFNRIVILCLVIISFSGAKSATVNISDAQTIALNFYKLNTKTIHPHTQLSATIAYTRIETDGSTDFYVFNIYPEHSFVIVSAYDIATPVLGYSTEAYFGNDFNKIGLSDWMNRVAAEIHNAVQLHSLAGERITNLWLAYRNGFQPGGIKVNTIAPLIATTWWQFDYYNTFCPIQPIDGNQCVTGCVATAMAQIMKYWNYPPRGMGSASYADNTQNGYQYDIGTLSSNFADHTYQWAQMALNVMDTDTAVARLMYDAGVSINMDYGDTSSNGYTIRGGGGACAFKAFTTNFGYSTTIRDSISDTVPGWTNLVENELTAGRPVLYGGMDTGNHSFGHAWVCDGFDANDMLHMNWGWGGTNNGYFLISNLTVTGITFDYKEVIIYGIQPPDTAPPVADFISYYTNTCNGVVPFIDLSSVHPTSWLWHFGDGQTDTVQNPTHVYQDTGTYTVTLTVTNAVGSSSDTMIDYIKHIQPAGPQAAGISSCLPDSFALFANTTDPVQWLDSTGTLISTSNPFITPFIGKTTTYWVEDTHNETDTVGPVTDTLSTPPLDSVWYLWEYHFGDVIKQKFNVLKPGKLLSVTVFAAYTATRTIQYTDSVGNVLADTTLIIHRGERTIGLNFNLIEGGPYYLGTLDTSYLILDTIGATYPYYGKDSMVSITGNSRDSIGWLGPFYNWIVSETSCPSTPTPVTVTIPALQISVSSTNPGWQLSNGTATVTVSNLSHGTPPYSYIWSNGDTTQTITDLPAGNYSVTVKDGTDCMQTDSINIVTGLNNVNSAVSFTLYPNPANNQAIIQMDKVYTGAILTIRNVLGQTLITQFLTELRTNINLSPFANGVYFIQLQQADKVGVKEIVISK